MHVVQKTDTKMSCDHNMKHNKIPRLKKRAQFLRIAKGFYAVRPALIVQGCAQNDFGYSVLDSHEMKIGFTASKKVGNAVTRNRAKRRLRACAEDVLPQCGRMGYDYVFIARYQNTVQTSFIDLLAQARSAIDELTRRALKQEALLAVSSELREKDL